VQKEGERPAGWPLFLNSINHELKQSNNVEMVNFEDTNRVRNMLCITRSGPGIIKDNGRKVGHFNYLLV
jgi:hypothetical protein